MRVAVTGGLGFIGAAVCRDLLTRGCEVHAIDHPAASRSRVADVESSLTIHSADILDTDATRALMQAVAPDTCIHLAWYVVPGKYLDASENISFIGASLRLIESAAEAGATRFVGAGTCFEYRFGSDPIGEDSETRPTSVYAACKLATFTAGTALAEQLGISFAWARLFYLYGPHEDENRLVPTVACRLLRGERAECTAGELVRDYLHVDDVASGICVVALSAVQGAVNVGSGRPVTLHTIINTIGRITGRSDLLDIGAMRRKAADPPLICADNTKLREACGWESRFALEDGLAQTIGWWRERLLVD